MKQLSNSLAIGLAALMCSACEPSVAPPTYDTSLDMKQLMRHVLEPASDVVWDSAGFVVDAEGEHSLAPTNDEEWAAVKAAGAMIVESGNVLMLPGRAPDADWEEFSRALSTVGHKVMAAADAQDDAAVFEHGATLYSVCVACHQIHAPGL